MSATEDIKGHLRMLMYLEKGGKNRLEIQDRKIRFTKIKVGKKTAIDKRVPALTIAREERHRKKKNGSMEKGDGGMKGEVLN